MIATYMCELCSQQYGQENFFVRCHGDVCHEEVCKNCAKKCKDPDCDQWVCESCLEKPSNKQYCGPYCIDCAMWEPMLDEDGEETDEEVNFDYVSRSLTHDQGLRFLKTGKLPGSQKKKPKTPSKKLKSKARPAEKK